MTEVLFYHLKRRTLDAVLPDLLERSLARGWRALVQCGGPERRDALDALLWTYRDDSFLPHGTAADGHAQDQPIYLTADPDNPNSADVRFLVDRAAPPADLSVHARAVFLFDGNDDEALADARLRWKEVRAAGHDTTYWQENERGGFSRKA